MNKHVYPFAFIPRLQNIFIKILVCSALLFPLKAAHAQSSSITWQVTLGGPGNDILQDISPTSDGNYILIGIDSLQGGDVEYQPYGKHDIWIIKMDPFGNIIWQKSYGGTLEEGNPNAKIIQTSDGGYLFVTETWSNNDDVVGHHGASDVWTVKLDSDGNIQWSHSFGGSNYDVPRNVLELPGHRYVIMSRSTSTDGDVPKFTGKTGYNAWVFIVNKNGNIINNHVFGGSGYDDLYAPVFCSDGSVAMFGMTSSSDGDLTGLTPDTMNAWYLRVDTQGNIIGDRVYPIGKNESFLDAVATPDGGFLACGEMSSKPSGSIDHGSYHGSGDFWSVKLDSQGNIQWQGLYGGSKSDGFKRVVPINGQSGYYLCGASSSKDGDVDVKSGNHQDMWVITIDSNGVLKTSSALGGSKKDFADAITSSGIAVGGTYSNDGDVTGLQGDGDGWVVQLKTTQNKIDALDNNYEIKVYPNPASSIVTVDLPIELFGSAYKLEMTDVAGKILRQENIYFSKVTMHISEPAGIYWLRLLRNDQVIAVGKLTVQ